MGTYPIFRMASQPNPRVARCRSHAPSGQTCLARRCIASGATWCQPRIVLFLRAGLPRLPALAANVCNTVWMLHSCVLSDDESCTPATHAAPGWCVCAFDETAQPVLRAATQQVRRAQRHAMGRQVPFQPGELGELRARV